MDLGTFISNLSPYARVAIASAPLVVSLAVRPFVGQNRPLKTVMLGSATWLAMNVVTSPYLITLKVNIATVRDCCGAGW
jgi:hypothetical protein